MRRDSARLLSLTLGLALAASVGLAACGDDSDDSPTAATSIGPEPTGPPIKLMVISQTAENQADTTMAVDGAEAAAAAINARGGVNGSPLRIQSCDDKFDPNAATSCARTADSDGVVAVVGSVSAQADAFLPVLEQAGIPSVGGYPISRGDFSNPISFPLAAGSPSLLAGAARALEEEGATRIAVTHTDIAQGALSVQFAEAGLTGTDATITNKVPIPIGAPDVAPFAASAARDSDGIVLALQPDETIKFLQSARQSGVDIPFSTPSLQQSLLEKVGSAADGLLVSSLYAPLSSDAPGIAAFKADMEQFAPGAVLNDYSLGAWVAVQAVAGTVTQQAVTDVTRETLLAALGNVEDLDLQGVLPAYTAGGAAPLPGLDRVFNPAIQIAKVEDGEVVETDGEWVNPLETVPQ